MPHALPPTLSEQFPAALSPTPVSSCPPVHTPGPAKVKVGILDFNFLMVLGKGSFGKVNTADEVFFLYAISASDPTVSDIREGVHAENNKGLNNFFY